MTAETDDRRRRLLGRIGRGAGGLTAHILFGGGVARADVALDVQILQTASSLETLAVATYTTVLGEGPDGAEASAARALGAIGVPGAKDTVTAFARDSRRRHAEHRNAFQAHTTALGGRVQDGPHPRFLAMVGAADVTTPLKLVDLVATLEKVATDSYLLDLSMLQDRRSKEIVAGAMAVASQHLSILRTFGALFTAGMPQLVAVPFPLTGMLRLPTAVGSTATPDAFHKVGGPELIAEPASGAVT